MLTHDGRSSGSKTEAGRKCCGIAKTVHGGKIMAIRAAQPAKMAELKEIGRIVSIRRKIKVR